MAHGILYAFVSRLGIFHMLVEAVSGGPLDVMVVAKE